MLRELFKFAKVFTLAAILMGGSFFIGEEVGKNNSRALQGCEVVATQALRDKEEAEQGLYETINYFQSRLHTCDEIMSAVQNFNAEF